VNDEGGHFYHGQFKVEKCFSLHQQQLMGSFKNITDQITLQFCQWQKQHFKMHL